MLPIGFVNSRLQRYILSAVDMDTGLKGPLEWPDILQSGKKYWAYRYQVLWVPWDQEVINKVPNLAHDIFFEDRDFQSSVD